MRLFSKATVYAVAVVMISAATAFAGAFDLPQQKALVVFWRSDCAPCHAELEIIKQVAAWQNPPDIFLATFDDDRKALTFLETSMPKNIQRIENGAERMAQNGNRLKALPFSLMTRADGSVCGRHFGILGTDLIKEWIKTC